MSERTTRFAAGLAELLREQSLTAESLASAAGVDAAVVDAILANSERSKRRRYGAALPRAPSRSAGFSAPLRHVHRCRDYAMGLDGPLFFPE